MQSRDELRNDWPTFKRKVRRYGDLEEYSGLVREGGFFGRVFGSGPIVFSLVWSSWYGRAAAGVLANKSVFTLWAQQPLAPLLKNVTFFTPIVFFFIIVREHWVPQETGHAAKSLDKLIADL